MMSQSFEVSDILEMPESYDDLLERTHEALEMIENEERSKISSQ